MSSMKAWMVTRRGEWRGGPATFYYDFSVNGFTLFNEKVGTQLTFHEETAKWAHAMNEGSILNEISVTKVGIKS